MHQHKILLILRELMLHGSQESLFDFLCLCAVRAVANLVDHDLGLRLDRLPIPGALHRRCHVGDK